MESLSIQSGGKEQVVIAGIDDAVMAVRHIVVGEIERRAAVFREVMNLKEEPDAPLLKDFQHI